MGFAGLATVRRLTRAGLRVTLVDRDVYSTFQPLLYQVATSGLNPSDVSYSLRAFAYKYGARFQHGELAAIDDAARKVTLARGEELEYDYLVLATGVSAAYYGVTGADKHSFGLYTRRDAVALRDQLLACLERLSAGARGQEAAITVVGGGATGVELAGTLADLRNIALATAFPEIDRSRLRIRLVEQAPALLTPYAPSLREYARRQLLDRGVEVRLDTTISEITADQVVLSGGERLPSDVTVWAAGVTAPESAAAWGLPQGRGGRIRGRTGPEGHRARPHLRHRRHRADRRRAAAAAGPAGAADGPVRGRADRPAGGRAAHGPLRLPRQGDHGHDRAPVRGRPVAAPRAHPRHAGLAGLARLHLVTLLGNRNRISALINLTYRYLSWGRGGAVIIDSDPPEG